MSERPDLHTGPERAALAADPTLVFRGLPPLELSPAEEAAEIESVRRAVAAMRAGRRLERSGRHWHRYAAAAVLTVGSLALGVDHASRPDARLRPETTGTPENTAVAGQGASRVLGAIVPASALAPAAPAPEVFPGEPGEADGAMEGLNRPKARVYQLHGRHLQVVMIVDEKLDV
jgi:hypothetical protein